MTLTPSEFDALRAITVRRRRDDREHSWFWANVVLWLLGFASVVGWALFAGGRLT